MIPSSEGEVFAHLDVNVVEDESSGVGRHPQWSRAQHAVSHILLMPFAFLTPDRGDTSLLHNQHDLLSLSCTGTAWLIDQNLKINPMDMDTLVLICAYSGSSVFH